MAQSRMTHQQHLLRDTWLNSTPTPSSSSSSSSQSNTMRNRTSSERRSDCEVIHSGHFMVSEFEAEAQDDEDTEISMPDPDESGMAPAGNTCTDVILAGSSCQSNNLLSSATARSNSSALIDQSLAKLFKCMNLAYR